MLTWLENLYVSVKQLVWLYPIESVFGLLIGLIVALVVWCLVIEWNQSSLYMDAKRFKKLFGIATLGNRQLVQQVVDEHLSVLAKVALSAFAKQEKVLLDAKGHLSSDLGLVQDTEQEAKTRKEAFWYAYHLARRFGYFDPSKRKTHIADFVM